MAPTDETQPMTSHGKQGWVCVFGPWSDQERHPPPRRKSLRRTGRLTRINTDKSHR